MRLNGFPFNYDQYVENETKKANFHTQKMTKLLDISMSIAKYQRILYAMTPELAIRKLYQAVKLGGILLLWVYGYEGNEWIVKYINPMRKLTSLMPLSLTHAGAYLLSIPLSKSNLCRN